MAAVEKMWRIRKFCDISHEFYHIQIQNGTENNKNYAVCQTNIAPTADFDSVQHAYNDFGVEIFASKNNENFCQLISPPKQCPSGGRLRPPNNKIIFTGYYSGGLFGGV